MFEKGCSCLRFWLSSSIAHGKLVFNVYFKVLRIKDQSIIIHGLEERIF